MKKFKLIILFVICSSFSFSQKVYRLEEFNTLDIKDSLKEVYFDRIFTDEIIECFDVSQEVFITEWSKFTRGVAKYLHSNDFYFGREVKANVEVFFNEMGKIDYFAIEILTANFTKEEFEKLSMHLEKFTETYTFTIQPKIKFSNFGRITFYD